MKNSIKKEDTIVIVYSSGCYGHWIDWCIKFFGLGENCPLPFKVSTGTSHRMVHNLLKNGLLEYYNYLESSGDPVDIVAIHPVRTENDNLLHTLSAISSRSKKVIFLTPDRDSLMLAWNNKWTKVPHGLGLPQEHTIKNNIKQWGRDRWIDMHQWEKREFLSFYWWPARLDEHNWTNNYNKTPNWDKYPEHKNLNIHTVTLSQLRDNCPQAILGILDYLELTLQQPIEELQSICNTWAGLQQHFVKDNLIRNIINSTVSANDFFDWSNYNLTLIDEATVQMMLRDLHNKEIKCYNLNDFPTNSNLLRNLTFDV